MPRDTIYKNMKTLLFLLLFSLNAFTQVDTAAVIPKDTIRYNLSNTLSGMYLNKQTNISYTADNSIKYKKLSIGSNTQYTLGYLNQITSNELLQKTNVAYDNLFLLYILNHSYTRKINAEQSVGIGYVYWWKYVSLSYACLVLHNTEFNYRHSFRYKTIYEHNLFKLNIEYYFQPNMRNTNDLIIYGNTKVTLLPKNKFSFTVSDNINYRSLNTIKMIHTINFGITYTYKK